jgi:hypothetical protein
MATKVQNRAAEVPRSTRRELRVVDDFLAPSLVEAAYQVFQHLTLPEGVLFLQRREMAFGGVPQRLAGALPDCVLLMIVALIERIEALEGGSRSGRGGGYEVWLGKTARPKPGAFYHVDNDEQLRRSTGRLVSPRLGAIMHLGPSDLDGGETLFELARSPRADGPELFRSHGWRWLVAALQAPVVVPQRPGRLILFPGDAPHAVAPLRRSPPAPRLALLANRWVRPPSWAGDAAMAPAAIRALAFAGASPL